MSAMTDFERTLAGWLEHEGPQDVPIRVLDDALVESLAVRQRPAWLTTTWWAFLDGAATKRAGRIDSAPSTSGLAGSSRLVWVAAMLMAILALLGGMLASGGFREREDSLVSDTPSAIGTMPPESPPLGRLGPSAPHILFAVSSGEAWAANEQGLWHFADDAWYGPMNPDVPQPANWYDLALDGDGIAWLAGDPGLWALADGRWTDEAHGRHAWRVVRAPDRGVWASTEAGPVHVWQAGWDQVARSGVVSCPVWGALHLAVSDDGIILGGGNGNGAGTGLVRIDDQRCESVYPLGDSIEYVVASLLRDPLGGVLAVLYDEREALDFSADPHVIVRYDGTSWSVLGRGKGPAELVVGPDGETWRIGWDAIVPVDDLAFDPDFFPTFDTPLSIAPDGTVWYADPAGVKRVLPG